MLYERDVNSFPELMKALRALDQDAGVRVDGRSGGERILLFLTRFGSRYTLMTYRVSRTGVSGRRLQTMEFDDVEALGRTLKGFVPGTLRAWVY